MMHIMKDINVWMLSLKILVKLYILGLFIVGK